MLHGMLGDSSALNAAPVTTPLSTAEKADSGISRDRREGRIVGQRRGQGDTRRRTRRDGGRDAGLGRWRIQERGPWLICGLFTFLYSLLAVLRYERRETMSWDLGIFTQAVRQYAHFHAPVVDIRGQGLNLLGDHFHPILAVLAPFFRVFPSPVTLLVGQSFLLALAAVPITRTAMEKVGRRQGYGIGVAYGLSWGIVQAANFDFHEIAFAVPLLAFSLCAHIRRDFTKTVLWALPLLLVKEDIALLAPMIIGMAIAEKYYKDRPTAKWVAIGGGIAAGIAVFFLLINVVIPHFNPQHTYLYWANGGCIDPKLGNGAGKLISCTTQQMMDGLGIKERTVLLTLIPTALLAVRSPITLLAIPAFVLKFMNTSDNYWGTDYHYSAVPMVIVFVAAIDGLVRMKAARAVKPRHRTTWVSDETSSWLRTVGDYQLRHGAVAMLAIGLALSQEFPLQDLWKHETYQINDRAHALKKAESVVPDDVSVEATISMLAPLAARTHAYWIGFPNPSAPEYVVFDLGRSDWGSADSAAEWVAQRHPGYVYAQVYKDPALDVYVFRRTS
jgi:uncharacterized membrane protein